MSNLSIFLKSPYVRVLRPKQYVKNVVIVIGSLATGSILSHDVLFRLMLGFVGFCFLSSAVYVFNDIRDVKVDVSHPIKKNRPIAKGEISTRVAGLYSFALGAIGLTLSLSVNFQVFTVAVIYVVINLFYSLGAKNIVVLDLLMVSSGFVIRGLVGVLLVPAIPTVWFMLLSLFASLLLISGKRHAELSLGLATRKTVTLYSENYLRFVRDFSTSGLIISYIFMVSTKISEHSVNVLLMQLSVVPFLFCIMLIAFLIDKMEIEDPTTMLLGNNAFLSAALVWVLIFGTSIYL